MSDEPRKKARKASFSPMEKTLKYYRDIGLLCQKVERWQSFFGRKGGVRIDLFGVIDIVAMGRIEGETRGINELGRVLLPDSKIFGIQCCGKSGFSEHVKKILAEPRAKQWCECGGRLIMIAWEMKKDGTSRLHYVPRIREFEVKDFQNGTTDV